MAKMQKIEELARHAMKLEVFPAFYFKVIDNWFKFETRNYKSWKKEKSLFFDNILQLY